MPEQGRKLTTNCRYTLLSVIFEMLARDADRAKIDNHWDYNVQHSKHFHAAYDQYKDVTEAIGVPDNQLIRERYMLLFYTKHQVSIDDLELEFESVEGV